VAPKVQTIELTGKRYKAMQLAGVVLIGFGVGGFCGGSVAQSQSTAVVGLLFLFGGAALLISGRALAWWHHS
jgi:uncharacterized membrane protein HdeD (DUF308 family)